MTKQEAAERVKSCEAALEAARKDLHDAHRAELAAKAVSERIVYAASARCSCGAGLAYDPLAEDQGSVFNGPLSGYWDCSAVILGTADESVKHTDRLPFAFWSVKEEGQPSAFGATTRPRSE